MNTKNLTKRLFTSIPLILLLIFAFNNIFALILSLILTSIISCIEFQTLISKIFKKKKFYKLFLNVVIIIYLIFFCYVIFLGISDQKFKINMLFLFLICIFSDIGGFIFGKLFKGKKLTKISPNKTISGSLGSFILSLTLVPLFSYLFSNSFLLVTEATAIAILTSLFCQLGDLFVSFLKRVAQVKDTGKILPGHGGLLDRIDGMLFAIPLSFIILKLLV